VIQDVTQFWIFLRLHHAMDSSYADVDGLARCDLAIGQLECKLHVDGGNLHAKYLGVLMGEVRIA
jgi:hypothetical protein